MSNQFSLSESLVRSSPPAEGQLVLLRGPMAQLPPEPMVSGLCDMASYCMHSNTHSHWHIHPHIHPLAHTSHYPTLTMHTHRQSHIHTITPVHPNYTHALCHTRTHNVLTPTYTQSQTATHRPELCRTKFFALCSGIFINPCPPQKIQKNHFQISLLLVIRSLPPTVESQNWPRPWPRPRLSFALPFLSLPPSFYSKKGHTF